MANSTSGKIHIAYLIDTIACDTAGTQKQLLETIRRLDRNTFRPVLVCLYSSSWLDDNLCPCKLFVLGYRGFLKANFLQVLQSLSKLLEDQKIDIVQTFFEDSIFVVYLTGMFGRSGICLLSSRRDMGLGLGNQPWYHGLFAKLLPYVNRKFSGIIANSEQVRYYVSRREKTPVEKIKVIFNGVDIPEKPQYTPIVFKDNSCDLWVGIVASLTPVKRHDLLFKAFAVLLERKQGRRVRMLLLGEGVERKKIEDLARCLGIAEFVHFVGAVRDVPAYLHNIDIGVLCSDREGLSNAILEYMACGLPVVATAVGGNVELVDSENGICVPSDDVQALADALWCLIENDDLRKKLGGGSLIKINRSFSWRRSMVELEAYYKSLVMQ